MYRPTETRLGGRRVLRRGKERKGERKGKIRCEKEEFYAVPCRERACLMKERGTLRKRKTVKREKEERACWQ